MDQFLNFVPYFFRKSLPLKHINYVVASFFFLIIILYNWGSGHRHICLLSCSFNYYFWNIHAIVKKKKTTTKKSVAFFFSWSIKVVNLTSCCLFLFIYYYWKTKLGNSICRGIPFTETTFWRGPAFDAEVGIGHAWISWNILLPQQLSSFGNSHHWFGPCKNISSELVNLNIPFPLFYSITRVLPES